MKQFCISTMVGDYDFTGKYLREREKPNWHYYETNDGRTLHFRKEHMVYISEKEIENK